MNVLNFLYKSEKLYPEKTAFKDDTEEVSYSTLKWRVESIGTAIASKVPFVNRPVVVFIGRDVASICSFLGVVASRNFYVPIDISQPVERINTIIQEIDPRVVLSVHENCPSGLDLKQRNIETLEYDEIVNTEVDADLLQKLAKSSLDTDPLYAICTSGSTGKPKAVLISHRSVLDFIPVFDSTFKLSSDDIFGNQAPFDFDVSVKDIYSCLYLGATMYVIPKQCFVMPKKLVEVLDDESITTIIWAVSAVCVVAGLDAFKHRVPGKLKRVMFSGEVMPMKMLNNWRKYLPNVEYVNLYGPTEITCNCMYYILDREYDNTEKLPLGIAFENKGLYVLNDNNQIIKQGETGEICVTGSCLALGYYNNPERTAQSFVQNPLNVHYPETMYRTGDLAKLESDGNYYFVARKDFQIKHMGHRIELEEIETHLNAIEGIIRACCLFDSERNKIVACYAGNADKKKVIEQLKQALPKYMIPNVFRQYESLPINKNGKIDRKQLFAIYDGES